MQTFRTVLAIQKAIDKRKRKGFKSLEAWMPNDIDLLVNIENFLNKNGYQKVFIFDQLRNGNYFTKCYVLW